MPPAPITIPLKTPTATYDITIAAHLLRTLYPRLRELVGPKALRTFVVTAPEIWSLWSTAFLASFPPDNHPAVLFLPHGERHKRLAQVESLAAQLARAHADRDTILIAFGGGVLGDVTGFLAAIYMRGIRYLQVPTTFLAQVDSSIGGKTGVNLAAGKNLIGAFHHPLAVLADTTLLATLPPRELHAGLHESIKAAIIRSPALFRYLESHAEDLLASDPAALTHVVAASVRIKAEVVEQDEKESNLRMILNFGHTLGHAIEAATQYQQLLHGEAVAWGSIAAIHLGLARRSITPTTASRMQSLILRYGPLPKFTATPARLVALTAADKKSRSGTRAFVLPTAIGATTIIHDVTDAELLSATNSMLTRMRQQPSQ